MTIYKYQLEITGLQTIPLPINSGILSVQFQSDQLCLWAMVKEDRETEPRTFEILGTGQPMLPAERVYIGTVQQAGGALVWHVFERTD